MERPDPNELAGQKRVAIEGRTLLQKKNFFFCLFAQDGLLDRTKWWVWRLRKQT